MGSPKPTKKKKQPPTGEGQDNSLLDLIQPDDSLSPGTSGEGDPFSAHGNANASAPDSLPSSLPGSINDPLSDLVEEFGADASPSPFLESGLESGLETGLESEGPSADMSDIPGLGQPLTDSDAEDLGIPASAAPADEITNALKTFLDSDASKEKPLGPDDFGDLASDPLNDATVEVARVASSPVINDDESEADEDSEKTTRIRRDLVEDAAPKAPLPVIENVKRFSNQLGAGKANVAAAYPFSLLITGALRPEEREKLLDILSRADLGIREPDLEPQLESGRVLIPRISEYAGILIVQSLRTASVEFRLGPSDQIFATDDTRTADDEKLAPSAESAGIAARPNVDSRHDADAMPITNEPSLPQFPRVRVVDFVTASAAVSTSAVEAERSSEYAELLEALQRELKYKAFRRGAQAIVAFSANLTSLASPTRYRLTVSGSAIRPLPTGDGGDHDLENTL